MGELEPVCQHVTQTMGRRQGDSQVEDHSKDEHKDRDGEIDPLHIL